MRRTLAFLLAAEALAAGAAGEAHSTPAAGPETPPLEYQVKAAFIYNFAKFVDWPASPSGAIDPPITICVLGEDPFHGALAGAIENKLANGRRLATQNVSDPASTVGCQILFVAAAENRKLGGVMDRVRALPILTIGETEEFRSRGGIIRFTVEADRVRFEINTDAADRASLKLSSKLLGVAHIITDKDLEGR